MLAEREAFLVAEITKMCELGNAFSHPSFLHRKHLLPIALHIQVATHQNYTFHISSSILGYKQHQMIVSKGKTTIMKVFDKIILDN